MKHLYCTHAAAIGRGSTLPHEKRYHGSEFTEPVTRSDEGTVERAAHSAGVSCDAHDCVAKIRAMVLLLSSLKLLNYETDPISIGYTVKSVKPTWYLLIYAVVYYVIQSSPRNPQSCADLDCLHTLRRSRPAYSLNERYLGATP